MADTERCLMETIACRSSTLDKCFEKLTAVTNEHVENCARKNLCRNMADEKMFDYQQWRHESIIQEIAKRWGVHDECFTVQRFTPWLPFNFRTTSFIVAQKKILMDAVTAAEDVLLREDHKFQDTVGNLQRQLQARQVIFFVKRGS